jgi:hypothetical protein
MLTEFEATTHIRAGAGPNRRTPIAALTVNTMQSAKDALNGRIQESKIWPREGDYMSINGPVGISLEAVAWLSQFDVSQSR